MRLSLGAGCYGQNVGVSKLIVDDDDEMMMRATLPWCFIWLLSVKATDFEARSCSPGMKEE